MPASSPSPLLHQTLPEFRRSAVSGGALFDSDAQRGHVVLVKFFAKYCAPCQRTLPSVEALHREHPDVVVVGVSEDDMEDDAAEQVQMLGLSFPVVLDRGHALAGKFRVSEMPVAFVADERGRVVWVGGPEKDAASMRAAVSAALRE